MSHSNFISPTSEKRPVSIELLSRWRRLQIFAVWTKTTKKFPPMHLATMSRLPAQRVDIQHLLLCATTSAERMPTIRPCAVNAKRKFG